MPRFDPNTGQPLQPRFDPYTGQPLFIQSTATPPPTNDSCPPVEYIEDDEEGGDKQVWWLIGILILVPLLIILLAYCSNHDNSKSVVEADSTEVVDSVDTMAIDEEAQRQAELEAAQQAEYERTHSDEAILSRAKEIFTQRGREGESKGFASLVEKVEKLDEQIDDAPYFVDGDELGTCAGDIVTWAKGKVIKKSESVAYVKIWGTYSDSPHVMWKMVYERGNWYVDDASYLCVANPCWQTQGLREYIQYMRSEYGLTP